MWAPHPLQLPGTRSTPPKDPRPLRESHPSTRLGQDASPLLPVSVEWPAPFAPGHMTADPHCSSEGWREVSLPLTITPGSRQPSAEPGWGVLGCSSRSRALGKLSKDALCDVLLRQGSLGRDRGQDQGARCAERTFRAPGTMVSLPPNPQCDSYSSTCIPAGLPCEDLSRSRHFSCLEPVDPHGSTSWVVLR